MWEQSFRDKAYERRLFNIRAIIAALFVLIAFGILAWRMTYLQVSLHEKYKDLSENNRSQIRPVAPNRGLIYDRNGLLLAENIPSYSLTLVPEKVVDMPRTLEFLDGLVGITERDREQFDKRLSYSRRPFEPVVLRHRLTEDEIATVLVNRYFLPGVDVEAQLVRHYPFGEAFSHVLGYVGRINQMDQEKIDADEDRKRRYRATRFIGKNGIERRYEDILHGEVGYEKVEINARGRLLSTLERNPPQPGQDLTLHLDSRLQLLARDLLAGRRGAIAAIEVKTGGILALYSNPSFDPNDFVTGISYKDYSDLRNNPDQPLFDRASRGQYPPASTLKPFVGLAALEAGVVNWQSKVWDPGWFKLENNERLYRDWKREGHGMVDLDRAVIESCDIYFYDVATRMGIDQFSSFLERFGFGQDTSLDVVSALPGLLPSKEWKRSQGRGSWYPGDTVNMGIGQGYMLVTPLQLATATAVLANKGEWIMPHLIADGGDMEKEAYERLPDVTLKEPANWKMMHRTMEKVIDSPHGTARALLKNLDFPIAGKTGTAQVVGIEQDAEYDSEALKERQRDHAWFMAFAPVDDPQIAIAVIVENGESSGRTAAPVAQGIINRYLEDKATDGR